MVEVRLVQAGLYYVCRFLIVDIEGTEEPVYSKDAARYAKACTESQGIAT